MASNYATTDHYLCTGARMESGADYLRYGQ